MNNIMKQEKGISMIALGITIIILCIITNILVYNAEDSIHIKKLTSLYNDIELLREKVSEYYNEYGKLPAEIKYTNTGKLSDVISKKNDTGDFYVIDVETLEGITLNYGKDYEKVKDNIENADSYTDIYIINEKSHNIFYVKGVEIRKGETTEIYYTDYTEPDENTVDLRYIDGILIPEEYYYIGKYKDNSGNESIVISENKDEEVDDTSYTQYIWKKQLSTLEKVPNTIKLSNQQNEIEFIKSVNNNKGYFINKNKTTDIDVVYTIINENEWSEIYTKECEYQDENRDIANIPKGFRVSMSPTMNTVANGLVAKDENENEWVWIEVPKSIYTNTLYTKSNNDTDVTSETDYEGIYNILDAYSDKYRKGDTTQNYEWKDEWYALDGDVLVTTSTEGLTETQKLLNNGCGLTYDEYETKYHDMLTSIYKNGGFWISRYEIGDSTATVNDTIRTSNSGTTGTAVSKANQIPYNFVTCRQAQIISNGMSAGTGKTSSLLFGIQWDLVCKFFEGKDGLKTADINSDSENWGNYINTNFNITSTKAKQYVSSAWETITQEKAENSSVLLTTGASNRNSILNIYDFAGNIWEWTLEKTSNDSEPCASRGGCYTLKSFNNPASSHNDLNTSLSSDGVGFRVTIY